MTTPAQRVQTLRLSASDEELRARFRELRSLQDVADLLEVSPDDLTWHLWNRPVALRYHRFEVPKRRGGHRQISAPSHGLKILQAKLAQVLMAVYAPKAFVHGFARGRGIKSNAAPHVAKRFVLNIDLQDFFPSIHFGRVRGLLMKWPYLLPGPAATTIAQLCFAGDRGLPQGAPSSPVVSNMVCARLDSRLARLAHRCGCYYSRYADDLTISSDSRTFPSPLAQTNNRIVELGTPLESEITANGFAINPAKIRLASGYERQSVTGLVVNKKINVERRYIRQVRAMLHALHRYGEALAEAEFRRKWDTKHRPFNTEPVFVEVLLGKLRHIGAMRGIHDRLYARLVDRARQLDARFMRLPTIDDTVLVIERDGEAAIGDGEYSQGSGFAAKGLGFITAAHVILGADRRPLRHMLAMRATLPGSAVPIELVHWDAATDCAVARMPLRGLVGLPVAPPNSVEERDEVIVLGFPRWAPGQPLHTTLARVTGTTVVENQRRWVIDQTIHPGASGGPVLDRFGRLVGIAVKGDATGQALNAFVPIGAVFNSAAVHGIDLSMRTRFRTSD
jgi:RNA-directed DNA polymerase